MADRILGSGGDDFIVSRYAEGTYFLVPVDVPATCQVHADTLDKPYLAVSLTLDPDVIATLLMDDGKAPRASQKACFGGVRAPAEMMDAWLRMMRLMDRILAPMIEREILLRALQGPLGGILRNVARPHGRMTQIRRVTQWIRERYAEPFRIGPLARMSDMSVAAFYRHFKSVTAMTPIQYQKRQRLLRARWLLLFDTLDATSIAYTAGYESASQFNREYARLFDLPPALLTRPLSVVAFQVPRKVNITDCRNASKLPTSDTSSLRATALPPTRSMRSTTVAAAWGSAL